MKIFIPFRNKGIGGTPTFVQKLTSALQKNGIQVTLVFERDFDILFVIGDCPLRYAIYAKLFRKKIIQRLDGVYHPATPYGKWYFIYNLKMKFIHNFLADFIVYQSKFSQLSCEKFLGKISTASIIIYNGTDTIKILPREVKNSSNHVRLLTFAVFRRRDQIEPIIEAVKLLDARKFSLDIYGTYTENLRPIFENFPPSIQFKGKLKNEDILTRINQYDIFLFSDQSACPNSVIESLAAGLPIAAYNRGSIQELILPHTSGEIVELPNHNPFYNNFPFDEAAYANMARSIEKISNNLNFYSHNAQKSADEKFQLDNMVSQYVTIINT